jgi:hypothetical protein
VVLALAFVLAVRCQAQTACVGDCDGSGAVTVDELITGVNVGLGNLTIDVCPAFDSGGDGTVTVDELLQGVNAALNGCGQRRPVANAGPSQIVLAGERVQLDGSAAVDPDRTLAAFAWSVFSLPSGSRAALSDPAAARPSFTADVPGTYVLQLVVNDMTADSDPDAVVITAGVVDLSGPPGDPANAHIPDIDFPDPLPEDLVAPSGIPISTRDLIVIVKETATVAEFNALVHSLPAMIVGGVPAAHLQLLRLMGPSGLDRVLNAQRTLLANPLVLAASINTRRVPKQLPPHNVQDDGTRKLWTWEVPLDGASGNWGLKAIRMPQAWNLIDHATRKNATIAAAVLESEEAPAAALASILHPDLAPRIKPTFPALPSNHATMVAGIIGATWDNNAGIDGIYPRNITIVSAPSSFTGSLLSHMINVLVREPNVRVINWSAGYEFEPVDPVTGRVIQQIDPLTTPLDPTQPPGPSNPLWRDHANIDGNTLLLTIQGFEVLAGRRDFLMFCAGSNYRVRPGITLDFEARDGSECSNVAVRGADPVLRVSLPLIGVGADHFLNIEPMDSRGNRSGGGSWAPGYGASAGSPGSLSAPGTCVRSTEFNDATNDDETACPWWDTDQNYATNDGSSFATPYATGLAAYLWSLDPELTYQQLRQVLTDPANTVPVGVGSGGGTAAGAPRVDAFAAAMGIDIIRLNTALQRALVDVNDGTLDGNKRTRRADDGTETGLYAIIDTADGRRGDGFVSMGDFRTFRDAMTQALLEEGVLAAADTDLDGGLTHFKKDLNFDGCVGTERANPPHPATGTTPEIPVPPQGCAKAPKEENVYPRYDFNGDGKIVDDQSESFKGRFLLDLGVLQELWPKTDLDANEGWNDDARLFDLLPHRVGSGGSGDIEFRTSIPLSGDSNTYDTIRITIDGLNMSDGAPMVRTLTAATNTRLVWTVPRTLGPITARAEGYKNNAKVADLCLNHPMPDRALLHGEDVAVTILECTGGPRFSGAVHIIAEQECYDIIQGHGCRNPLYELYPGADIICPPLGVTDKCLRDFPFPGAYSTGSVHWEVERIDVRQWRLTISTKMGFTPPPVPPVGSCTPAAACKAWTTGVLEAGIGLDTGVTGNMQVDISCAGSGDYIQEQPHQFSPIFTSYTGGLVFPPFPPESESPFCKVQGGAPWEVTDSLSYNVNSAHNVAVLGLSLIANAQAGQYQGGSIAWEHTVNANITVDITVTPLP